MRKNNGWINALFSLVFIAVPAIVIFFFYLPGWTGRVTIDYGYIWLIAILFFVYVSLLSWLLIYFDFLPIESLNFNIPIAICLMTILVSYPLPLWATALLVFFAIMIAIPVNIFVRKYKRYKMSKLSNKSRASNKNK